MKQFFYILLSLFLCSCSKEKSLTVYIAAKGKKYYHTRKCKLQGKNKDAISICDAITSGYQACKRCKPLRETIKNNSRLKNALTPKTPNSQRKTSRKGSSSYKKRNWVQCSGITQSGRRCKRKTKNSSGRCYQH